MPDVTVPTALLAHAAHSSAAAQSGGLGILPLLLAGLPFLVGGALLSRSKDAAIRTVVVFSAAAGFVHAVVTPHHFREDLVVGLFTLAVTLGQMAVVVAGLHRPSRGLWRTAIAGNAAVLAIWGLSRTAGLPVGPEPWAAEELGFLDLTCSAYEVALVACCVKLARSEGRAVRWFGSTALLGRRALASAG